LVSLVPAFTLLVFAAVAEAALLVSEVAEAFLEDSAEAAEAAALVSLTEA
jgi:hypothetical protein